MVISQKLRIYCPNNRTSRFSPSPFSIWQHWRRQSSTVTRRAGRILMRKTAQAGEGAAPYLKREQVLKEEETKHKNKKAETSCSLRMNHII